MTLFVENLNSILATGTVLLQIVTLFLFVLYLRQDVVPGGAEVADLVTRWGIHLAFAVTAISSALTLYYSEILGFAPCSLCWFQRIFLYPQVVLFAIASFKKDASVAVYAIWLSILGLVPSLYQHVMQTTELSGLPCPAGSTEGVNCAQRILFEFGYVTYPLMAATLFAFVIMLMLFVRRKN